MSALWHQIARDPNLLSAAVFGGCLLLVGLVSVLWFALFQQEEGGAAKAWALQAGVAPSTPASGRSPSRSPAGRGAAPEQCLLSGGGFCRWALPPAPRRAGEAPRAPWWAGALPQSSATWAVGLLQVGSAPCTPAGGGAAPSGPPPSRRAVPCR